MNPTKEQLIQALDSSFIKVALEDMARALKENTNLAVFILGVCLIDALAGFRFGKTEKNDKKDGERFKGFVGMYLTQYSANDLWDVRNGLLHSYTVQKYSFVNKKQNLHDKITNGGRFMNDENFYNDLKTAYEKFKKDVCDTEEVFEKVKIRYNTLGLMSIASIEEF